MSRQSEQEARDKHYGPLSKESIATIEAWAAELKLKYPDTIDGDYWSGLHIDIVPEEDNLYSIALSHNVWIAIGSRNIYHVNRITLYSREAIVEMLSAVIQQVAAETAYTAADVLKLVQITTYQHPPYSYRNTEQIYGANRRAKEILLTRDQSSDTLPAKEKASPDGLIAVAVSQQATQME